MSTKLILDTDIGTDVDDAWALALCLASQKIGLVGITLVHADLETRARITFKMLKLAGRTDIPVYKGVSRPITPNARIYWGGHEGANTDFSDIADLQASDGAVDFILQTIQDNPGEVVLCPVGPLTNIAEAIKRSPETMRKARKLVIMGTTFAGEGPENAAPEHNGCVDPQATSIVLKSGIPALVVGLNVTTRVLVRMDEVAELKGHPFGDYLAAMTEDYVGLSGRDFTFMHDPLAVSTLIDPDVVTTRRMTADLLEDGSAVYQSAGLGEPGLDVCVDVDSAKFGKLLLSNIHALVDKHQRNDR